MARLGVDRGAVGGVTGAPATPNGGGSTSATSGGVDRHDGLRDTRFSGCEDGGSRGGAPLESPDKG